MLMAQTCLTHVSLLLSCSRLYTSLPINLPSWDTPRRTADDILLTVGAPGRGVHVVSISNKMVRSVGSSSLPQPGQISMVRSIYWIINADRVGELLEPTQIDYVLIIPTPATANPIDGFEIDSIAFISNSSPASSLPEEAGQQGRSDRVHRSGRSEAR